MMSSQGKKRRSNSSNGNVRKGRTKIDFSINGERKGDDVDADSVSSHEDDEYMSSEEDSSEVEEETLDAKRIRMARDYLNRMEDSDKSSDDDEDDDDDDEDDENLDDNEKLSRKLEKKRLKRSGLWDYPVAKMVEACVSKWWTEIIQNNQNNNSEMEARMWREHGKHIKYLRGPHDLTVTCVALSSDGQYAFSGSKDHSIAMWDTESKQIVHTLRPAWSSTSDNNAEKENSKDESEKKMDRHGGQVLAMEIGGKYLAVGQRDATVHLFNAQNTKKAELLEIFKGHTRPVTSVAFNSNASSLFTGSEDRCIRHISLEQMSYVETLYGHQAAVSDIDCNNRNERPLTVGRDRTARCWKLQEESHFIFRGGARMAPADAVAYVQDNTFITGHDDGTLAMWNTGKKKPTCKLIASHGQNESNMPRPVVSLAVNNDLAISGSNDGYIRLWKIDSEKGELHPIGKIPIHGYINDIAISHKAQFCVVAVGQEPKLGRWDRVPRAKNRLAIVQFQNKVNDVVNDDDDNGGDDIQIDQNVKSHEKNNNEEEDEESEDESEEESNE